MEFILSALLLHWFFVTVIISVCAGAAAVWFVFRARRAPGRCATRAGLCVAVALLALAMNPIVNLWLFYPCRTRAMAVMLAEVGQPAREIVRKYGEPHAITAGADGEVWRYRPGPWYALLRWEEVVYRVRDGQIQAAFVDD